MKRILVVNPTPWDEDEIGSPRYAGRYEFVRWEDPDLGAPPGYGWDRLFRRVDVLRAIDRAVAENSGVDGVIGTDEYLACAAAAAIARRLGLPGPEPAAVLTCQHKYYGRLAQRLAAPEAVPRFEPVDLSDPRDPGLGYPLFIKPARGTTSVLARRVDTFGQLKRAVSIPWLSRRIALGLMRPFNDLLKEFTEFERDANCFLAEDLLRGSLVTLEGFATADRVEVLGVTDSVFYSGTMSFRRFDYPSRLPGAVQERMRGIARRVIERIGLRRAMFNIEFFHDPAADRIGIVEINPRMSYQFSDLYEKVDGINSYDVQVALAAGEEPRWRTGAGRFRVASSFVLRKFADARAARVPGWDDLRALAREFPDSRVRIYATRGARLSRRQIGVESYRYAIVNLGGASEEELHARFARARRHLPFEFK
jgi:hypothetical protein